MADAAESTCSPLPYSAAAPDCHHIQDGCRDPNLVQSRRSGSDTVPRAGLFLLMFFALLAGVNAIATERAPLSVVPAVDYKRYEGTWYEIARLPNRFQKKCASDVVATYTLRDDGRLTIQNRCRLADGRTDEATGVARPVAGQPPSVLKVRFAPAYLSFLPLVWGDYQILALGPAYEYAVIGEPTREYLWVLSRSPTLEAARYEALAGEAKAQGFDVSKLVRTRQTALQDR